jgi:iron complex outermembrane receptor protein
MTRLKPFSLTLTLLLAAVVQCPGQVPPSVDPVELPELQIWGRKDLFREQDSPTADGGDYLSRISGISGSRMGGHGTDVIIRGQQQDRNNVLLDGCAIQGGCPNRMDPPTSYAPVEFYDTVRVIKGPQTLRYGPGGTGGIVLFERSVQRFAADESARLSGDAGYAENGAAWHTSLDASAGNENWQARLLGSTRAAKNYRDGEGVEIRSGYKQQGISLTGAYRPKEEIRLGIGAETTRAQDVLFAGAMMDSPESDSDTFRLRYRHAPETGGVRSIELDTGYASVGHIMDNYSLRPNTKMWMRVPSNTSAITGRLNVQIEAGIGLIDTGLNFQRTQAEAIRYGGPAGTEPTQINSYMWPEVERSTTGLYGEYQISPDGDSSLLFGLRYDFFDSSAGKTALDPPGMMMSPDGLYTMYYRRSEPRSPQQGAGVIVRYERNLGPEGLKAYLAGQRSLRDADPTERFIAANNMNPTMRWVGNPGLNIESHNRGEVGLVYQSPQWLLAGSAHGDWVDDFILRDRAHGQEGISMDDGARIYRNVSASLTGFEFEATFAFTEHWRANGVLAYVQGENSTDDRSLPQIPPLEGAVGVDYTREQYRVSVVFRFAARQDRVDDDPMTGSGLDGSETAGWTTLDLEGRYRFNRYLEMRGGIRNCFDQTYAIHTNRADLFSSQPEKINEPGRSIWVALNLSY